MDVAATYLNTLEKKKNQLIFNSLTDAILIETSNRLVEYANTSFCTLFKVKKSPEELVGTDCKQSTLASSFLFKNPSKFIYRLDEIIEAAQPVKDEEVLLRDGRTIIRDYFPLTINNTLTGHLWVYRQNLPATQMHYAQQKEKLNLFEHVLNNIDTGIAIFTPEQRYMFINKTALPNKDKRSFITGKTDIEYCTYYNLDKTLAEIQQAFFQQALTEKKEVRFEEKAVNKKGKEVYRQVIFYPVLSEEKEVEVVIRYVLDITLLKENEQQLQQTIHHYNSILNKLNDVVLLADDTLKVDFINDAWKQLFAAVEGDNEANIFSHISLKKYEFYKQAFSVLDGSVNKADGKIDLLQKDGSKKWFKYSIGAGLSNKKNDKGIVTILNDITKEMHLEENLLEVVKREKELNDIKSAFVNMVSHELRTPLAVISSGAELIQMMLNAGRPKEEIGVYAAQILSEVDRMTTFMNDLLMVSKIEAGKIDFNPESTSLTAFVNELAAKSYSPWKDGRSLTVAAKGDERQVNVDTKMTRHILQNLIDNAFKYSTNTEAPKLRIRYSRTFATISVIDNGIGIHNDDIVKLFASFSRGRNVANIAGTGMGLVVVKYFVNHHKGTVAIKSRMGNGTIFSVKIPY